MSNTSNTSRVWDPFVRFFHWTLVLAFATAWLTGEDAEGWAWLHEQAGYYILALLGLRMIWGFVGSRHARFSDFLYRPARILAYTKGLFNGQADHYLGHNPAGGLMVILLLTLLTLTGLSGLLLEGSGREVWEEFHEFVSHLVILLVIVHVVGVVVASRLHGENLVKAMLTGRKEKDHD